MIATHTCVDCAKLPEPPTGVALPPGADPLRFGYRPARPRATTGGPRSQRCEFHKRALRRANAARDRATHKARQFGLTPELQALLWTLQGSACPCGAKAAPELPSGVATDHDHELALEHDHPADQGCPGCVTGFLCMACNTDIVGRLTGRHGRAGVAAALRAVADHLDDPPMARLLRQLRPPCAENVPGCALTRSHRHTPVLVRARDEAAS